MVLPARHCMFAHLVHAGHNSNDTQNLKRVEVIEDDEDEIVEAVRRMSDRYDFVVTRYDETQFVRKLYIR